MEDAPPPAPIDSASFGSTDGNYHHVSTFAGKPVLELDPAEPPPFDGTHAYRVSSDWDDAERVGVALDLLLAAPRPAVSHLIIGCWGDDLYETPPDPIIERLVGGADHLPNLQALFVGDIISEENEMSWIIQCDLSPLLKAFPKLEVLRSRGGESLALVDAAHPELRCLALETGGMDASVVRSVLGGQFPKLEHLELWLGTDAYGGSTVVEDLQPLFAGGLFPNLRYLGLRNCDFVDDIAGVIVNSPIVERIKVLDLSLGTLTDDGGQALLSLPAGGSLQHLDLHHHFLTDEMTAKIEALPYTVNSERDSARDLRWRFVAVGE